MPDSAVSRLNLPRFILALSMAATAFAMSVQAASDARPWPDQGQNYPLFLFTMENKTSLTGFGCDVVAPPSGRAFADDPDYSETAFTVGLEMFLDEAGELPTHHSGFAGLDSASAADTRTPLSARLSTTVLHDETSSLGRGGAMEDVFVPEASMSIADLAALCLP